MRLRAILPIVVCATALAGCNLLVSKEPWFQTDPSAPALRDGVWRAVDADCAFDDSVPVQRWPDCSDWAVLKDGRPVAARAGNKTIAPGASANGSLVLSPGNPMIWQAETLSRSGGGKPERHFDYYSVDIEARDPDARITKVTIWPIFCGPFDEDGQVTVRPWPGLAVVDNNCTAASAEAVREAARRSRKLVVEKGDLPKLRWVRDGSR